MTDESAGRAGPPAAVAWLVHLFTATGAFIALLALLAIEQGNWRMALLWLSVALVVDGIDGTLARWARVKEQAARVDGDTLDLVIDFLTYVFVPMLFIWRAGLVPESLALWLAAAILFSSLYLFARTDMKTADGYFRGFPSLWNLVAFYLYALGIAPAAGAAIVLGLVLMTFAPVHFVHPFRVRDYGPSLPLLAVAWAVSSGGLMWWTEAGTARSICLFLSVGTALALLAMGFLRTIRGSRPVAQNAA